MQETDGTLPLPIPGGRQDKKPRRTGRNIPVRRREPTIRRTPESITNYHDRVQVCGEQQPQHIRHEKPRRGTAGTETDMDIPRHEKVEDDYIRKSGSRVAQREKQHAPQKIRKQLHHPQKHHTPVYAFQNTSERNSRKDIHNAPDNREERRRRG